TGGEVGGASLRGVVLRRFEVRSVSARAVGSSVSGASWLHKRSSESEEGEAESAGIGAVATAGLVDVAGTPAETPGGALTGPLVVAAAGIGEPGRAASTGASLLVLGPPDLGGVPAWFGGGALTCQLLRTAGVG